MKPLLGEPSGGIILKPCQACDQLKTRFYLCDRGHSTCHDCQELRNEDVRQLARRFEQLKNRSPSNVEKLSTSTTSPPNARVSANSQTRTLRSSSPPNSSSLNFAFRSPIGSLTKVPRGDDSRELCAPRKTQSSEVDGGSLQIFCQACGGFVEAISVTLPTNILKLVPQSSDVVEAKEESTKVDDHSDAPEMTAAVRRASDKQSGGEGLRKDVDNLFSKLVTAYSQLLTAKKDLNEVGHSTEKLGLDVDMLRGGVNFLYFNFDVVLKTKEVRIVERICGVPFVIMVSLRKVSRISQLGFFIGLEPSEGLAHSPLKKTIVLRAHNAYGKVIEAHTLETFENGKCVHPCFDMRQRPLQGGLWGYADFLKKDRILKPDMLKDGILCLSLQIKMLQ